MNFLIEPNTYWKTIGIITARGQKFEIKTQSSNKTVQFFAFISFRLIESKKIGIVVNSSEKRYWLMFCVSKITGRIALQMVK